MLIGSRQRWTDILLVGLGLWIVWATPIRPAAPYHLHADGSAAQFVDVDLPEAPPHLHVGNGVMPISPVIEFSLTDYVKAILSVASVTLGLLQLTSGWRGRSTPVQSRAVHPPTPPPRRSSNVQPAPA